MPTPRTLEARNESAHLVANAIHCVETSLNRAIVDIGKLFVTIGEARLNPKARMPLTVGMAASERAAMIASTTVLAYRQSVEAHSELAQDKANIGLATVSWGDVFPTVTSADETIIRGEDKLAADTARTGLHAVA